MNERTNESRMFFTVQYLKIHEKNITEHIQKSFGVKVFQILTRFEHYFYIGKNGKYTLKERFPPYQAVLKQKYLELEIEFLHSVKSANFV